MRHTSKFLLISTIALLQPFTVINASPVSDGSVTDTTSTLRHLNENGEAPTNELWNNPDFDISVSSEPDESEDEESIVTDPLEGAEEKGSEVEETESEIP